MLRTNKFAHFLYLIIDSLLISVSFLVPYLANPSLVPHDAIGQKAYLTVFFFWGICLIFILNNFHLYITARYLNILKESFVVSRAVGYASILAALFIYLLKINIFSRTVFVESVLALLITTVSWRILKRICVRRLIESGFSNYNVLLIGSGEEIKITLQEIKDSPFLGLRVKGILNDKETDDIYGFKILGKLRDLEHVVKKYFIDEIYIVGLFDKITMRDLIAQCKKTNKAVRVILDDFGLYFQGLSLNYLGSLPLITYFQEVPAKANGVLKRLFDICVSGVLLIILLPVFLTISLFIKMESKGPVFYTSKRSGRKGKIFNFYKFRSMLLDAEKNKEALREKSEVAGPIFKIKKDPRITRVGRFLRKHSLDELPQIINVLKGDMSLVGPRPFPVEESNKIEYKHIPRLNIRPGITGLAQIKGRSDLKFNQWMRWDAWYFNNCSLGLDIKILLWTIPAVFNGKGAY